MQPQNVSSGSQVSQAEDVPEVVMIAAELKASMPGLLAALDAAEAAGDQLRAVRLITKIYATMDAIARLPGRKPA